MKVLHFGAGNIGRGFVAPVLFKDSKIKEIFFTDVNKTILDEINLKAKYNVIEKNQQIKKVEVENISAIYPDSIIDHSSLDITGQVDMITISIGQNNLKYIVPQIIEIIKSNGKDLIIMCCENGNKVSSFFKTLVAKKIKLSSKIHFVDCVVDRIVPNQKNEGLDVEVEEYYSWVVDNQQWPNEVEKITSLKYSDNIDGEINKKICLLNGTHSALGWFRWQEDRFQISNVRESLQEKSTKEFLKKWFDELVEIISQKYNFQKAELQIYGNEIVKRFSNPFICDDLDRVCRNPIQKIQINERILSPLIFGIEHNLETGSLKETVKNCLNYTNKNDSEGYQLRKLLKSYDLKTVAKMVIENSDDELIEKIL